MGERVGEEYEVVNPEGKVVMRTNRNIMDDSTTQKLSGEEIEALKKGETASGKDIIAKILESHTALDKKTAFSLAKYTLRKRKKYLRRFTVFPLDVAQLADFVFNEKDPRNIMEIREEVLSIILSWSNVHAGGASLPGQLPPSSGSHQIDHNRWLVVDDTAGLLVAALAERMGILYPTDSHARQNAEPQPDEPAGNGTSTTDSSAQVSTDQTSTTEHQHTDPLSYSSSNTITLVHSAIQPNVSLLSYFSYDPNATRPFHPLNTHFKSLSWLQLLHPTEDATYREPSVLSPSEISNLKAGKRSVYFRKRRRWVRVSSVVDETRSGGFTGLVVASSMALTSILHHLVPLLRGGAQVVVYAPNIEPLMELMDYYSSARRSAFLVRKGEEGLVPSEEFPVDPTLVMGTALHMTRAKPWQVLPGRTHPLMTGRGGAEGGVFVGTRILPVEGKISARGQFKRRKTGAGADGKSKVTDGGGSVKIESMEADMQVDGQTEEAAGEMSEVT